VRKQVLQRLTKKPKLTDKEVPALGYLSSSMRAELRFEMYKEHLMHHPLFRLWTNLSTPTVTELCSDAVDFMFFQESDDIFIAGNACDCAYYIVDGVVRYTQEPESAVVSIPVSDDVCEGLWMCECALWTEWVHVGRAHAKNPCQLLMLPAARVLYVLKKHRLIQEITLDYCTQFHKRVTTAFPPHADWPTDLKVPHTEFPDIVMSMNSELQCAIGLDALMHVTWTHIWGLRHLPFPVDQLKEEVLEGRSIVVLDSRGEPERAVSVTALRIKHEDGVRMFVQLGTKDGSQIVARCELPGAKQEKEELPMQAVHRIIREKLNPMKGLLEIVGSELKTDQKESRRFRMRTKYLRTEVSMNLKKELDSSHLHRLNSRRLSLEMSPRSFGHTLSLSSPSRSSSDNIMSSLVLHEVYAFKAEEDAAQCRPINSNFEFRPPATHFFAWLTDEDCERLCRPEAETMLEAVLRSLASRSDHAASPREETDASCEISL